ADGSTGLHDSDGLFRKSHHLPDPELSRTDKMDNTAQLSVYIPEKAAPVIARWIDVYKIRLKISRRRSTKLGDYRPPQNGHMHRISVNGDLNPYAFLVTLVHEFAHLVTWNRHGPRVRAHGKEWKGVFRQMMQPFLDAGIFPGKLG